MSTEQSSLVTLLLESYNDFTETFEGKTLEDIGGQQGMNQSLVYEISKIYTLFANIISTLEDSVDVHSTYQSTTEAKIQNIDKRMIRLSNTTNKTGGNSK